MVRSLSLALIAVLFASCATQKFGDAFLYGHTKDVTEADIRAALAVRTTGGVTIYLTHQALSGGLSSDRAAGVCSGSC